MQNEPVIRMSLEKYRKSSVETRAFVKELTELKDGSNGI